FGSSAKFETDGLALSGELPAGRCCNGAIDNFNGCVWINRGKRGGGKAAVANRQVRSATGGPAFQPVASGGHIVQPKNRSRACGADSGAEDRLGPGRMTDHCVEPSLLDESMQCTPCPQYAERPSHLYFTQAMHRHSCSAQFGLHLPCETQRELTMGFGAERT